MLNPCSHDCLCSTLISDDLKFTHAIASYSDNANHRGMILSNDGCEEGITAFTHREIKRLKELLADIHTFDGGVRQFLVDEQCK